MVLISGTKDTVLLYIRLIPIKVRLFSLGLNERISAVSSLGGEGLLTLKRSATEETYVIKDRCVGAQGP